MAKKRCGSRNFAECVLQSKRLTSTITEQLYFVIFFPGPMRLPCSEHHLSTGQNSLQLAPFSLRLRNIWYARQWLCQRLLAGLRNLTKKTLKEHCRHGMKNDFLVATIFGLILLLSNIFLSSSSVQIIAIGIQLTYRFTSYTSKIGSMCNILRKGGKERKKVFTPPFSDCFISS